jgi:hypothetical protein
MFIGIIIVIMMHYIFYFTLDYARDNVNIDNEVLIPCRMCIITTFRVILELIVIDLSTKNIFSPSSPHELP